MQLTINRNLLKYSAGRAIFCGQCDAIADARRWVLITHDSNTLGMCACCWDKLSAGRATRGYDVLDGRVIFGARKKPGILDGDNARGESCSK
jgi:hypothetical protein